MTEMIIGHVTQVAVVRTLIGIQSHFPTDIILEIFQQRIYTSAQNVVAPVWPQHKE